MTTRTRPRSGFTLIELLVVIGIIVVIAGLAVLFLPNLDKNKGVPNAAAQFHGWVNIGKQQALRDKAPRGIRLVQDPSDPLRVTAIQYIEQPEPVAPRGPFIRLDVRMLPCFDPVLFPVAPFVGPLTVVTLFQADYNQVAPGQPPAEQYWINWDSVAPGDYLELTGGPQGLGLIRRFTYPPLPGPPGIPPAPLQPGTARFSQLIIDRVIDGTEGGQAFDMTTGFRVIRAPRPLVGEPMLQLHKDVFIDLTWCYPCPLNLGPPVAPPNPFPYGNNYTFPAPWGGGGFPLAGSIDILFNSTGIVANAPVGRYVVAIRHIDRPNDMLFVTIFTRTGSVAVFSVNDAAGGDPYVFTQQGTSSGL